MYFIYDCNGKVCGNPKGYATCKAADRQANSAKTKAGRHIWEAFNLKSDLDDRAGIPAGGRLIYEVKPANEG